MNKKTETQHRALLLERFADLSSSLEESKNLEFDRHVYIQAWNLQVESEIQFAEARRKTRMSLDPLYYVYVLMDPRKPGNFGFTFPGGRTFTFPFEPFYVGKGRDGRFSDHCRAARKSPTPVKGQHKLNIIRAIYKSGHTPVEKIVSSLSIEAVALVKEEVLIEIVGRRAHGGPLVNLAMGGEGGAGGVLGRSLSDETKAKIRASNTGKTAPAEVRNKMSANSPRKGKPISEKHRAAIVEANKRRKGTAKKTPVSDETRLKLSLANKGKAKPESVKAALSESNRRRKGETRTPKDPESYARGWATRRKPK